MLSAPGASRQDIGNAETVHQANRSVEMMKIGTFVSVSQYSLSCSGRDFTPQRAHQPPE